MSHFVLGTTFVFSVVLRSHVVDGQSRFRIELGQLENVKELYYFIILRKHYQDIKIRKIFQVYIYITRSRVYNSCNDIVIVSFGKILIECYDLFATFEFVTVNISLTMSDMEILSK